VGVKLPTIPRRTVPIIQIVGGLVFVASFFLPAVFQTPANDGSWGNLSGPLNGLTCAFWSLLMLPSWFDSVFKSLTGPMQSGLNPGNLLAGLAGLVNPFLLCYLFAAAQWRRWLATVVGVGLVSAAGALVLLRYPPLIGFFLWVAGALAILSPELAERPEQPKAASGEG